MVYKRENTPRAAKSETIKHPIRLRAIILSSRTRGGRYISCFLINLLRQQYKETEIKITIWLSTRGISTSSLHAGEHEQWETQMGRRNFQTNKTQTHVPSANIVLITESLGMQTLTYSVRAALSCWLVGARTFLSRFS